MRQVSPGFCRIRIDLAACNGGPASAGSPPSSSESLLSSQNLMTRTLRTISVVWNLTDLTVAIEKRKIEGHEIDARGARRSGAATGPSRTGLGIVCARHLLHFAAYYGEFDFARCHRSTLKNSPKPSRSDFPTGRPPFDWHDRKRPSRRADLGRILPFA